MLLLLTIPFSVFSVGINVHINVTDNCKTPENAPRYIWVTFTYSNGSCTCNPCQIIQEEICNPMTINFTEPMGSGCSLPQTATITVEIRKSASDGAEICCYKTFDYQFTSINPPAIDVVVD